MVMCQYCHCQKWRQTKRDHSVHYQVLESYMGTLHWSMQKEIVLLVLTIWVENLNFTFKSVLTMYHLYDLEIGAAAHFFILFCIAKLAVDHDFSDIEVSTFEVWLYKCVISNE